MAARVAGRGAGEKGSEAAAAGLATAKQLTFTGDATDIGAVLRISCCFRFSRVDLVASLIALTNLGIVQAYRCYRGEWSRCR